MLKKSFRDLAINILASIIFTILLSLINKEFLKILIPLWIFIFSLIVVLPLIYQSYKLGRKSFLSQKRVFIISSAITSAPFFAELVNHLTYKLEALGFIPEIKLPHEDFSINEINRHIDFVKKNKDYYVGGFFIHSEPERNFENYKSFSNIFDKPLIFLDVKKSELYKSFPNNCSFLGFDNSRTGVIAAEYTIKVLQKHNINNPQIFIIASKLQSDRQNNFKLTIEKQFTNRTIEINELGDFNRRKAYKIIYEELKSKIENKLPIWDVIFCTNDEMALGALHAIYDINTKKLNQIILIGVDGIEEAKNEIDKNDFLFLNTVDQNPKSLAEDGIAIFTNKFNGVSTLKSQYLEPHIYRRRV
jgi:ribose transport system substrate-binding protein